MTDAKDTGVAPADTPAAKAAGMARGPRILLALSLAANLAVAGFVVGHALDGGGPDGHMERDVGFGAFTDALGPKDRKALREALFARAPDLREARRAMEADQVALVAALRANPFDAAAVTRAIEVQNARMAANLTLAQSMLRDHITAMSPEDRLAFADRLEARIGHGGPGDDKGDKGGD